MLLTQEVDAMSEPRGVSVIVVNYNNERFLAAAIDSALGQNHPLYEVIVVDDCSTDNSRAIIARYCDRIIVRWIAMEGVAHPCRQTIHSSNGGGGREHGVQGACL